MKSWIVFLALATGASAQEALPEEYGFELHVEVGHYGMMLEQAHELMLVRLNSGIDEPQKAIAIWHSLRSTVWRYNFERATFCEHRLFVKLSCAPALIPEWMSEPADVAPSMEKLQKRADEVSDGITQFWDTVCAAAKKLAKTEQDRFETCAME